MQVMLSQKLKGAVVYDTQNHWACGLCPSPEILNSYTTRRFGNWIVSVYK
jgi:hypothetical protein